VQEHSEEESEEQSVGTAERSSIQFWDSDEEGETSSENSGMYAYIYEQDLGAA
jgi:hypothetical protein